MLYSVFLNCINLYWSKDLHLVDDIYIHRMGTDGCTEDTIMGRCCINGPPLPILVAHSWRSKFLRQHFGFCGGPNWNGLNGPLWHNKPWSCGAMSIQLCYKKLTKKEMKFIIFFSLRLPCTLLILKLNCKPFNNRKIQPNNF